MIRKKLIRLIKKITVSLVLVFTLATPFYTLKAYVPEQYVLKESSINYNIPTKKILLDLAHHDTTNDKGCSFGKYNERDRNYLINQQDRYAECIAKGIYEQLMRE